jgi:hypothetical protein
MLIAVDSTVLLGSLKCMKSLIQISCDGQSDIHVAYQGEGYATLCGLDGNDQEIAQITESHPKRGKITCQHCKRIAEEGRKWRASDFA